MGRAPRKSRKNIIFPPFVTDEGDVADIERMASEISTNMPNQEKCIIPDLKFLLRALVIGGLFNITKIFTKKIY